MTHRTTLRAVALLAAASTALAACSSDGGSSEGAGASADAVTVENCGTEVTTPAPPERIVSLNQSSTEILLALGLADRMVGTATWTDPVLPEYAEANESIPRLSDNAPSFEAVLDAEPDFVTASFTSSIGPGGVATREQFSDLGVGTYISPTDCEGKTADDGDGTRETPFTLDTLYKEITQLSELFGVPERGDALIDELEQRMTAAQGSVDADGASAMYWFANSESPYMAGCCGSPGVISDALDVENVFDDTFEEWPQIAWEVVAERNPDVIVLGDLTRKSQTAETAAAKIEFLESNPVTREMEAVKNKRYISITGAEMNPSIRTVAGVETVARGLTEMNQDA